MPCIATGDSIISVQGSDSAIGLIFMYLRTAGTFSASWFCFRYVQSKDVVDAGLSGGRERREKEKGIKGEVGLGVMLLYSRKEENCIVLFGSIKIVLVSSSLMDNLMVTIISHRFQE